MKHTFKLLVIAVALILITLLSLGCREQAKTENTNAKSQTKTTDIRAAEDAASQAATETIAPKVTAVQAVLYFSDEQAQHLAPEMRSVEGTNKALAALEELVKGPREAGHYPTVPAETKVISVEVTGDVAKINLSKEFIDNNPGGSTSAIMAIFSVVNTATEATGAKKATILIEGKAAEELGGIELTEPIARDESLIKK